MAQSRRRRKESGFVRMFRQRSARCIETPLKGTQRLAYGQILAKHPGRRQSVAGWRRAFANVKEFPGIRRSAVQVKALHPHNSQWKHQRAKRRTFDCAGKGSGWKRCGRSAFARPAGRVHGSGAGAACPTRRGRSAWARSTPNAPRNLSPAHCTSKFAGGVFSRLAGFFRARGCIARVFVLFYTIL